MTPGTRIVLCGEAAVRKRTAKETLCLRNTGANRNVNLEIDDLSRTLATDIPNSLVDLVEIATFVYVADQYFRKRSANSVFHSSAEFRNMTPVTKGGMYGMHRGTGSEEGGLLAADDGGAAEERPVRPRLVPGARAA